MTEAGESLLRLGVRATPEADLVAEIPFIVEGHRGPAAVSYGPPPAPFEPRAVRALAPRQHHPLVDVAIEIVDPVLGLARFERACGLTLVDHLVGGAALGIGHAGVEGREGEGPRAIGLV